MSVLSRPSQKRVQSSDIDENGTLNLTGIYLYLKSYDDYRLKLADNCSFLFTMIRTNMLTTKHNSCLYLSQSLSLSLHLYIRCSKKSVRNREIQRVGNWRRHIHKLHILVRYTILRIRKKVSLFDLLEVGNNCICRICFANQAPEEDHLDSQLIYEYIDLIKYQHRPERLFKV